MSGPHLLFAVGLKLLLVGVLLGLLFYSPVLRAVFFRNVLSYFSGVLGYLFIIAFVTAAGFLAFQPQFFTDNLLNLDQLSHWYPMLLLFIIPAITMSSWSDERKLGTDELLFTLPGRDWEIVAGKFLAVTAVYTVALGFSGLLWFWLWRLGSPDWGMIFSTYFGYWLAGVALVAAGMFASALTNSATVAFVLGVLLCAIPVFVDWIVPSREAIQSMGELGGNPERLAWFRKIWGGLWNGLGYLFPTADILEELPIAAQLRDFSDGVISLRGVIYFVSFAAFMLYLNLVFVTRRHWSRGQTTNMGLQFAVRSAAMAAVLVSLNAIVSHAAIRADMTEAGIYTLSDTTTEMISKISADRPVRIQAFISPHVPRDYVAARKKLLALLREYDRLGGGRITVREVAVEPFSPEAEEAKAFGIEPKRVSSERDGKITEQQIVMGAVITSSYDEVVIPMFSPGTPAEYELTRSIRTVSNENRLTIGVLNTDAHVISGQGQWRIISELRKQYLVEEVSAESSIDDKKYDVLLAILPSSLGQNGLTNLVDYVKKGRPTLIFDDPFPIFLSGNGAVSSAPRQTKPRQGGMFGMGGPPPEPKGDDGTLRSLLDVLDLRWDNGQIAWDGFNPHPKFQYLTPEFLFITPQSGVSSAISSKSDITRGLQEILFAYAGTLRPLSGSKLQFEPLLRTSLNSGLIDWDDFSTDTFDPSRMQSVRVPKPSPPRPVGKDAHVIAYHITSDKKNGIDVVFVADVDCIATPLFNLRDQGDEQLNFDNVPFVLNAIDVLAGEEAYLKLRSRRSELKTLEEFEKQTSEYEKLRRQKEKDADKEAKDALEAAKNRFKKQREAIEKDTTIDEQTKETMIDSIAETESRRSKVDEANIETEKQDKLDKIKAETERSIRRETNRVRAKAIGSLPIPAFILGCIVLALRLRGERQNIKSGRLAKQ